MTRRTTASPFGLRLRKRRLSLGYTARAVAGKAAIDPTTLWRLETGRMHPGIDMALRLARALDTTIDFLATGKRAAA